MKFRIPFRRTAVTQLKNGEGGGGANGTQFGKKRLFRSTGVTVLIVLVHHMPHSIIKIIYPIKLSDFLFTGSRGGAFQVKKIEAVLFKVVSREIVRSTTTQYRCFLNVRGFIEAQSAAFLKQVKILYDLFCTIPVAFND